MDFAIINRKILTNDLLGWTELMLWWIRLQLNGQKSSRNRYFNRRLNQKRPQNYQNQRKSAQSLSYSFANINTSSNSSDSLNKLYKTIKAKNSTLQRKERESGRRRLFFGDRFYVFHPSLSQTQLISGVSYSNHKTGHLIKHQRIDLQNHSSEGNEPHSRFKFFGIEDSERTSYAAFMNSKYNMQPMREPKDIDTKAAKKWCDNFKLTSLQRKKCRRDAGLPQVLAEATQIAAAECQYQFRYERWNCSLGTSRIRLLDKGKFSLKFSRDLGLNFGELPRINQCLLTSTCFVSKQCKLIGNYS